MATVTGYTAAHMQDIIDSTVSGGHIDGSGHLILDLHDGSTIDAGYMLASLPTASDTVQGKVELATDAETITGTDATRAVTPHGLNAAVGTLVPDATTSVKGKVELATSFETIVGTDLVRAVTPAGLKAAIDATMQLIFPVGAIYTSYSSSTSPATLLGFGTWTAISDRILVGAGSTFTAGATGGSTTHTLSTANLAPHTHGVNIVSGTISADHSHNVGRDTDGGSGTTRFTVHSSGSSGAGGQAPTSGASANHTHNINGTSDAAGSGTAVNHMNPYVGVYLWRRTA